MSLISVWDTVEAKTMLCTGREEALSLTASWPGGSGSLQWRTQHKNQKSCWRCGILVDTSSLLRTSMQWGSRRTYSRFYRLTELLKADACISCVFSGFRDKQCRSPAARQGSQLQCELDSWRPGPGGDQCNHRQGRHGSRVTSLQARPLQPLGAPPLQGKHGRLGFRVSDASPTSPVTITTLPLICFLPTRSFFIESI